MRAQWCLCSGVPNLCMTYVSHDRWLSLLFGAPVEQPFQDNRQMKCHTPEVDNNEDTL